MSVHTKESIISTLQNLAANLGKTVLSQADVKQTLSEASVRYHFGSLRKAVEAAGLEINSPGQNLASVRRQLSEDDLFSSVHDVEQNVGHEPSADEYNAHGRYSSKPFRDRFGGKWSDTLAFYRKWKADSGPAPADPATSDNKPIEPPVEPSAPVIIAVGPPQQLANTAPIQFYGEPFDFRGLRHAPINEQGVVYLFGMVSRELGFYVEAIQQGFPDCEAKYLHDKKKGLWARARIEFEFKASSFRDHGHDASKCDLIICWINDWHECPLRVIELREEIRKLPSR